MGARAAYPQTPGQAPRLRLALCPPLAAPNPTLHKPGLFLRTSVRDLEPKAG